jgi:hypothetical protein
MAFETPRQTTTSRLTPRISAGVSAESTQALKEVLEDDLEAHHAYFGAQRMHKYVICRRFVPNSIHSSLFSHSIHHGLAIWALGAPAEAIKTAYKANEEILKTAISPPESITDDNFHVHLGDDQ